ncbi:MAG: PD40 domain-containing protein, partial [Planctomycetaceae bacterium]|nr:PD40 domain-containing protein [Planctomycetaceae bacterium]
QAHCQGCHQPAKAGGDYIMTNVANLLHAGESGEAAIVPGKPDESYLIAEITPGDDGQAEMPKGKPALKPDEIDLIRRWIAEGAVDDTPENARREYDQEHLPVYTRPPVVTSLTYSPDGQLIAVAGFHEVLLHRADGSGLVARLVGMSERIETVAFSPDGRRLAVAGGNPGRLGELQIWNLVPQNAAITEPIAEEEKAAESTEAAAATAEATPPAKLDITQETIHLAHSISAAFDTIYGASWSPDGTLVAVGCPDNVVRGYNTQTGEQVFFNGAHDDWPLATIFSVDGSKIVSVGRDMATKLYEVGTQRFVDNVTSITPGALKGGLSALARHPERDEVLVGGSDGVPRIYRMERITKRVIGDDANLIRKFPGMQGRVFGVAYSPDGKQIACAATLDGQAQVFTYSAEFDSTLPDDIKGIVQKVVTQQNQAEKDKLEAYVTADVQVLKQLNIAAGIYALAYAPDGTTIAVAGSDGTIRLISATEGTITKEFAPIDIVEGMQLASAANPANSRTGRGTRDPESLPSGSQVTGLTVIPSAVTLHGPWSYTQLLAVATLSSGEEVDVTRIAQFQ